MTDIRKVKECVEYLFNALGKAGKVDVDGKKVDFSGTVIPAGNKNTSEAASEFFVADLLRKAAEERFKKAKKEAEEQGILGSEESYVEGETVMAWNSPDFTINVKKGKPSEMIDREAITAAINEALPKEKAAAVLKAGMKPRKGTTTITTAMK